MKNKKTLFYVSVLIILLLAVFLYLFPFVTFVKGEHVLERGVEYPAGDFISKANGEVLPEAEFLNTAEVGKMEFHYTIRKWIFKRDVVFSYEVVDTTPPEIQILNRSVVKNPGEPYSEEEIRENIVLNEGSFVYETDYDKDFSGTYIVTVTAEDEYGNVSQDSYEVVVIDDEAPLVFFSGNGARVSPGSEFDIQSIIAYGDNADPAPVLEVEGEVDTSRKGKYPLHAILSDASGNRKEWDLIVNVSDEVPEEDESEEYFYPFAEFVEDYAGEGRSFGIDISTWQGDIDFEAVKQAGCEFVLIRIGFSYDHNFTFDHRFKQNLEGALNAGLKTGIYYFSYDRSEEELLSSLDIVFEELKDVKLDLPIVFDWEDFAYFQDYEISFQDLNHLYTVFEEKVEEEGYEAMLYGSAYYLNRVWSHTDTRKIWLAQYSDWPSYESSYQIWQLSDCGRIEGIDGPVDLDIMFE